MMVVAGIKQVMFQLVMIMNCVSIFIWENYVHNILSCYSSDEYHLLVDKSKIRTKSANLAYN